MNTAIDRDTTSSLERFCQEVLQDPLLQEELKTATNAESISQLVVSLGQKRGFAIPLEKVRQIIANTAAPVGPIRDLPMAIPLPMAYPGQFYK